MRFIASIGEPWDFSSSVGANRLEGVILNIIRAKEGQPVIHCAVSPFDVFGVKVSEIVAVNRYVGSQDVEAVLSAGKAATMNFIFSSSGKAISADEILDFLTHSQSRSFLIGSMTLTEAHDKQL
jgi:hypothetical protein